MREHAAGRYRVGIITGADGAIAYEIRTADGAARITLTRAEAAALADAITSTLPPPRPIPEFLRQREPTAADMAVLG